MEKLGKRLPCNLHPVSYTHLDVYKRQVLPSITNNLPAESFNLASLNLPKRIFLADPHLHCSAQVDILIGAQYFLQLIEPMKFTRGPHFPIIQETKLGFILAGDLPFNVDITKTVSSFMVCKDCLLYTSRVDSAVLLYFASHRFEVIFSIINGMPRSAI